MTVVPARTPADDVISMAPDGVFLSNGPGDPAALPVIVAEIRRPLGACRSSASVWATNCSAWRSAAVPSNSSSAIAAAISL